MLLNGKISHMSMDYGMCVNCQEKADQKNWTHVCLTCVPNPTSKFMIKPIRIHTGTTFGPVTQ